MAANPVSIKIEGEDVVIRFKLRGSGERSASGKSIVIASTRGNVVVPDSDGLTIGLNAYRKA